MTRCVLVLVLWSKRHLYTFLEYNFYVGAFLLPIICHIQAQSCSESNDFWYIDSTLKPQEEKSPFVHKWILESGDTKERHRV